MPLFINPNSHNVTLSVGHKDSRKTVQLLSASHKGAFPAGAQFELELTAEEAKEFVKVGMLAPKPEAKPAAKAAATAPKPAAGKPAKPGDKADEDKDD